MDLRSGLYWSCSCSASECRVPLSYCPHKMSLALHHDVTTFGTVLSVLVWLQLLQGLIWVWAEPGPLAFIESAASTPILDPMRSQAQNWSYGFKNYIRDVPGWVVVLCPESTERTACCVLFSTTFAIPKAVWYTLAGPRTCFGFQACCFPLAYFFPACSLARHLTRDGRRATRVEKERACAGTSPATLRT